MTLLLILIAVAGSMLLGFTRGSRLDGSMLRSISRKWRRAWSRLFDRLANRQITVAIAGDEAGFRYTVQYPRLRLLPRILLPYDTGEIEFDTDDLPADRDEND